MGVPQVAIVGRPNVGKSSILNWLSRKRLAITNDQPGVTRDRVTFLLEQEGRFFELVDTGGMGFQDIDNLTKHVEEQIQIAMDAASVILFVVDAREGMATLDQEVARRLRFVNVPIICVVNKTDDHSFEPQADEFYKLGLGKLVKVSTLQNRNREELLDMIVERLPPATDTEAADSVQPELKVAIVGRRNTGKSTFVNMLAQAERMIVSEIPGTTRDSVDVRFELDGKSFTAIDTPGLRRTRSITTDIDFYGLHRAQRSIRRADLVFLFFDCSQRISKVDKQLCDYVAENYKPCVLVVNKWDMLHDTMPTEKWVHYLHDTFRTMHYAPIAFITAKTGKNVKALINHGQMLFRQSLARISTADLNKLLRDALIRNPPPLFKNRRPKIYYATQVAMQPPTIVLFCNNPAAIDKPYQRYLLGKFRDNLPFSEVPIKLYLRQRAQTDDRADADVEIDEEAEAESSEI